jgi:tellurite resistance protein TehA-like permease
MATGIVSIAAELQAFHRLALALFGLNIIAFLALAALTLCRLGWQPAAMLGELWRHESDAGFLTFIAATAILGNQFALLSSHLQLAAGLWLLACVSWVALVYAYLFGLTITPDKPPLAAALDGSWLLLVVSSEALTILGSHVADTFSRPDIVVFLNIC